jgi:RNA polymerase sigma-70 factor, ECF subfamily
MSEKQFIILYDTYAPKIYRFLLSKVSAVETAQDLTSETFLKAWDYVQSEKNTDIAHPAAFLFRIARNLMVDYYRVHGKRKEISLEDVMDKNMGDSEMGNTDIAKNIDDKIDMSQIKDTLAEMSQTHPDYADVLVLYYVEDIPMTEIAHIMDRSEGAVRVLVHRALKELQSRIKSS